MSSERSKPPKPRTRTYERPRGGQARAIADLMPDIGRAAFRRFGFVQSSVVSRWPEIVGPHHARTCAPEAIRFAPGEPNFFQALTMFLTTAVHSHRWNLTIAIREAT